VDVGSVVEISDIHIASIIRVEMNTVWGEVSMGACGHLPHIVSLFACGF
jgi:hypothetical protein